MNERVWDKFLTERDKAVFSAGGFGAHAGFGKRPALLVIDVNWAFCGLRPEPILESIKSWRTSCGEEAWVALDYIKSLIDAAHHKGLPVIYTTGERRADNWDAGSWRWKSTRGEEGGGPRGAGVDGNEIVATIAPGPQDIIIRKQKPSGFFGTNLAAYLTLLGCDSVVIVGTTTSGCVRATVVDAFSLNYRVALAEEGCFDRSEASRAISLCDMHAKYADVVPTAEVLSYFDQLRGDLFDLPSGGRNVAPPIRQAAE
jgi:nicotinamidase-related amidase